MAGWFDLNLELRILILKFAAQSSELYYRPVSAPRSHMRFWPMARYKPYAPTLVSRKFIPYAELTKIILRYCYVIILDPWYLHILRNVYPQLSTGCSIQLSYWADEQYTSGLHSKYQDMVVEALCHPLWSVKRVILDMPEEYPEVSDNSPKPNIVNLNNISMGDLHALMTTDAPISARMRRQLAKTAKDWLRYEEDRGEAYDYLKDTRGSEIAPRDTFQLILVQLVLGFVCPPSYGYCDWLLLLIEEAASGAFDLSLSFKLRLRKRERSVGEIYSVTLSSTDWLINLEHLGQKFSISQELSILAIDYLTIEHHIRRQELEPYEFQIP